MTTAGPVGPQGPAGPLDVAGTLGGADRWFLDHGLTYFVPEARAAVRAGLRPRRLLPPAVATALVAVAVGVGVGVLAEEGSVGVAVTLSLAGLAVLWYALTALRGAPIIGWAAGRTFGSLARVLPMMTRALPLLLLFVTFLFINAEVWQMSASVSIGALWLAGLLFAVIGLVFLLVRLPEEVDKVDDDVDDAFLERACRGTPLAGACARLLAEQERGSAAHPAAYATITGFERWNLVLALLIMQVVQVLLLAVGVFVFFLVFGSVVMTDGVQLAWTGLDSLHAVAWFPNTSLELVRVSLFLASFSLLYLTVSTVTDETYRAQFFGGVLRELERAVGMRAVYLALRAAPPTDSAGTGCAR